MIRLIMLLALFFFQLNCNAQLKAVTGTGDEVILYDNGTWKYANKTDTATSEIQTNRLPFKKSADAKFKVSSNIVNNVNVYINPKKWSFKKGKEGGSAEYNFQYIGKDAYGMVIAERMQIPLTSLRDLALKNAISASPDIKVVKEEYRNVNGTQILYMQWEGTISGIDIIYANYYYSGERGVIQMLTYTSKNLFSSYKADMDDLLNGLEISE